MSTSSKPSGDFELGSMRISSLEDEKKKLIKLFEDIKLGGNLPVSALALAGDSCLVYARRQDSQLFRVMCRRARESGLPHERSHLRRVGRLEGNDVDSGEEEDIRLALWHTITVRFLFGHAAVRRVPPPPTSSQRLR